MTTSDNGAGGGLQRRRGDVVVVGAGLAGLVATCELLDAGRRVILVDQESPANLGGQAYWSFGGLFLVDSPEQRRLGIRDSISLAWRDWEGTAGFDRDTDYWPKRWARAYVEFAGGEKRAWLRDRGVRFFPVVGWAERGDGTATGHGNSVPRFHITWGTGPALVAPFADRVRAAANDGLVELRFRHRVEHLAFTNGRVDGVAGSILADDDAARGVATSREVVGGFELAAGAVVITSGGIGGNHDLVRHNWPRRLGTPPRDLLTGVPAYVDGRLQRLAAESGASLIGADRMWHYVEGVANWDPIWPGHAIRILPGPSPLWLDATGKRLPPPYLPGFDTLGTLAYLRGTGHDHSWFVVSQPMLAKEFTLSGSEQNPDLTGRDVRGVLGRARSGIPEPVAAFVREGVDWVSDSTLPGLVAKMNALVGEPLLDPARVEREVRARDGQIDNPFSKDAQVALSQAARHYRGDRMIRVAAPHQLLDPAQGPLVAIRLRVLTRKTLGGLETNLKGQVLRPGGQVLPGLYAAGEVAGFGGGGMHGYRALEGTFLGGCLYSGRAAGRAAAAEVR